MDIDRALSRRIRYYRRAFSRGLGFNPNGLQRALMDRAAKMAAQADQALDDPHVSLNDRVRICGAADRTHALMTKALEQRAKTATNEWADFVAANKATAE